MHDRQESFICLILLQIGLLLSGITHSKSTLYISHIQTFDPSALSFIYISYPHHIHWIAFIITFISLIYSMAQNNKRKNANNQNGKPNAKRRRTTNENGHALIITKLKSGVYSTKRKNNKKFSSPVWDHAHFVINEKGEAIFTKCKHCNQIYALGTSSSSWSNHLKSKHSITPQSKNNNNDQKKITDFKGQIVKFTSRDKLKLKDAAVKFCVLDLRPFFGVNGDGFDYAMTVAYNLGVEKKIKCKSLKDAGAICDRTTVSREIATQYGIEKAKCIKDFQRVLLIFPTPIHGTTDCSEFKKKRTGEKVMGVTIHFAIIDNPLIQIAYLRCDNFKQSIIQILNDDDYVPIADPDEEPLDDIESDADEWDAIAYSSDEDNGNDSDSDQKNDNDNDGFELDDCNFSGNYANIRSILKYTFNDFKLNDLLLLDKRIDEIKNLIPEIDISRIDRFRSAISTDNHSANKKAFGNDDKDKCKWLMILVLCFNHNFGLVISWMIKNVKKKHQALRRLLRLIKKLIKRIKKSNLMSEYDPTLKTMIEARWEGIYECLKSIISGTNYDTLNKHCGQFGRRDLIIRILKDNLVKLTQFFERIVVIHKHFEFMHKPRMHHVIQWTHYILFGLSKSKQNEYSLLKKMKKEMHKQTIIRIVPKISFHHYYASLLNPKTRFSLKRMLNGITFTHLWTGDEITIDAEQLYNATIENIKKDLLFIECVDKYIEMKQNENTENENDNDIIAEGKDNESENEDVDLNNVTEMFNEIGAMFNTELDNDNNNNIECELDIYLKEQFTNKEIDLYDDNPLLLWNTSKRHKKMSKLARLSVFHLTKQPASSPSEFLFSLSNNIVTFKRTQLAYSKINLMTFLVSRWKLNK